VQHPEVTDTNARMALILTDLVNMGPHRDDLPPVDIALGIFALEPDEVRGALMVAAHILRGRDYGAATGWKPGFEVPRSRPKIMTGSVLNADLADVSDDVLYDTLEHQWDQREALTGEFVWELLTRTCLRLQLSETLRSGAIVVCRPAWALIDTVRDFQSTVRPGAVLAWAAANDPELRTLLGSADADRVASRGDTSALTHSRSDEAFDRLALWLNSNDAQLVAFGTGGLSVVPPVLTLYWGAVV
jgi:hypothetical protein